MGLSIPMPFELPGGAKTNGGAMGIGSPFAKKKGGCIGILCAVSFGVSSPKSSADKNESLRSDLQAAAAAAEDDLRLWES